MPKGPRGEKRPADVIGAAIMVGRIATGEITEKPSKVLGRAIAGKAGGNKRAKALTAEQRKEIAKKASEVRWKSKGKQD